VNFLRRFLYGRYGPDALFYGLSALAFLLAVVGSLGRLPIVMYVGYLPMLAAFWRMLSKKHERRRRENAAFLRYFWSPVSSFFKRAADRRHRYFCCPKCACTARVPRGKGKIAITCPKCGEAFVRKT